MLHRHGLGGVKNTKQARNQDIDPLSSHYFVGRVSYLCSLPVGKRRVNRPGRGGLTGREEEGSLFSEDISKKTLRIIDGGRQPGETTIVSWKKLIKDANKAAKNNNDNKAPPVSAPPVPLPVAANPALDPRITPPPGDAAENEANDAPTGSRFSAVIEKIGCLYMGKNSSDEEDPNNVPDDDEYDTEDSFVDDTELVSEASSHISLKPFLFEQR
ncbi:hypothetical protein L2E82_41784 [Cichorium intybus]|uniref:Uncharacterized protein n=1 Tax=Cichorium intybus TaxID=13427 RepID=A0ACB8ZK37_CICIN|nr:hypothetical protein L2E82_41784 [Cichorium intybus]